MAFSHRPRGGQSEKDLNEITRQFIREHLNSDVPTLALKKAPVGTDLSLALRQIEARQLLQKKAPTWSNNDDLLFPVRLSIEQCSSDATAQYKANLMKGKTLSDLTGGLGIDTYFLSQHFQQTDYVEQQPELCDLARHNFAVLNTDVKVLNTTAEDYLIHCEQRDIFYLDPARRDIHGHKTVGIGDCYPNVAALQETLLQKAKNVMIKLSPMLDITQALAELHCVKEVHVLAVSNECKELVFILERGFLGQPRLFVANLLTSKPTLSFTFEEENACPLRIADGLGRYLYEPHAALMKAGGFKWVSEKFGVAKLHKNSHLYTYEHLVSDFPGRIFEVEGWAPYNKKVKATMLSCVSKANVAVRNFPLSVEELRKALKISEGGDCYLFATTLRDEKKVLIKARKSASN